MRALERGWFRFLGLLMLLLPVLSPAQTFHLDSADLPIHSSEVTIAWDYQPGGGVTSFAMDILFDATFLDVDVANAEDDVVGCLDGVAAMLSSCRLVNPGQVRILLVNFGAALDDQSGSLTFRIAPSATGDDFSLLEWRQDSVSPEGASLTLNNGAIDILWGDPASLAIGSDMVVFDAERVEVEWLFEPGNGLRSIELELEYDPEVLALVLAQGQPEGCLSGVIALEASCEQVQPGRVRLQLNQGDVDLAAQAGSLAFTLIPGVGGDDASPLGWTVVDSFPVNPPIIVVNGLVDILWGPPGIVTLDAVDVFRGESQVTVDWSYQAGSAIHSLVIDVEFDQGLFEPITDGDGQILGCLAEVVADNASCVPLEEGVIRLSLERADQEPLIDQGGQLTFAIVDGVLPGDTTTLAIGVDSTLPDQAPVQRFAGRITVVAAPAEQLRFDALPRAEVAGWPFRRVVVVSVIDQYGFVVETDNDTQVVLSLEDGDPAGQLSGALTQTVIAGQATFSALMVDLPDSMYRLRARDVSGTLPEVVSMPFMVRTDDLFVDRFEVPPF